MFAQAAFFQPPPPKLLSATSARKWLDICRVVWGVGWGVGVGWEWGGVGWGGEIGVGGWVSGLGLFEVSVEGLLTEGVRWSILYFVCLGHIPNLHLNSHDKRGGELCLRFVSRPIRFHMTNSQKRHVHMPLNQIKPSQQGTLGISHKSQMVI